MTAGEALRGILGVIDLKQIDLAKRAGLTTKHVNQVVRGTARVSPDVAVAIADAIAEYLVGLDAAGALARARNGRDEP